MQSCYPEAISRVLKSEGGYVNLKSDPGGPTNFGITIAVYRENGHASATAADVKAMRLDEAKRIYKARYADPCGFDDLPSGLDYAVLDYAVNSGVSRANKVLRRILNLADGAPFHEVLGQISTRDPKAVISALNDERLRFLSGLKTWPVFGKGWATRIKSVRAAALAMNAVGGTPVVLPAPAAPAAPAPPVLPQGKGEVPKPDTAGPIVATGAGGSVVGGFGFGEWISAHPMASAVVAVVAIVVIAALFEFISRKWQASNQDAPTPGLVPVPEKA